MSRTRRTAALGFVAALSLVVATPALSAIAATPMHSPVTVADGELVLFAGIALGKGAELFVTDGTDAGTRLVKDIYPGSKSGFVSEGYYHNDAKFTPVGDKTFFVATDATGLQLWVTDGTAAGTVRLTAETPNASGANPQQLTVFNGELYFSATSATAGVEVWRSDGTVGGTGVAFDIDPRKTSKNRPYSSYPSSFAVVGSSLFFITRSSDNTGTVRTTDGLNLTGEVPLAGVLNNQSGSGLAIEHDGNYVADMGGRILVSDGTVQGTTKPALYPSMSFLSQLVSFDGQLYYSSFDSKGRVLKTIVNGRGVTISTNTAQYIATFGGKLWYTTYNKVDSSVNLWSISASGEAPINLGVLWDGGGSEDLSPTPFVFNDGNLYVALRDMVYASDGTPEGTTVVTDLGLTKSLTRTSDLAVLANGTIVVTAKDWKGKASMWLSDGTTAGTYRRLPQSTFTTAATPTVTGSAIAGNTLAGTVGKWSPSGATYSYQWKADGVAIPGATAKNLTVSTESIGAKLTLTVTGSKPGYKSLAKVSGVKTVVAAFDAAPTPTISGTLAAGNHLTAMPGEWSPAPTFTYQWYANGKAIKGKSTSVTYKLTSTSALKSITVRVTAKKSGYATTSRTSAPAGTLAR